MSTPSDRIRAILARSEASHNSGEPTDTGPTPIAVNVENLAALLSPEDVRRDTAVPEAAAPETVAAQPAEEVEDALPLLAASDENRTALAEREKVVEQAPLPAPPPRPVHAAREPLKRPPLPKPPVPTPAAAPLRARNEKPQVESQFPLIPVLVGIVVAVAAISAFLLRDRLSHKPQPTLAQLALSYPLQLAIEPRANGMMDIRWNSQGPLIDQAREGRLVLTEHDQQPRVISLSTEQLKIGHVLYQSPSERLEIRLEVVDQSGAVTQESVLALASGTPAAAAATQAQAPVSAPAKAPSAPPATAPAAAIKTATPPAPAIAKASEPVPPSQPARPPVRTFILPPPSQSNTEEKRAVLLDAPVPAVVNPAAAPANVTVPAIANGVPKPPAPPPPAPPTPAVKPVAVGGKVQSAVLLKKVAPIYPGPAAAQHIEGTVRFNVTIGADGRIKNLQPVSGNPMLLKAASDAVQQWVYQPLLLDGIPSEVTTQVDVIFSLHP